MQKWFELVMKMLVEKKMLVDIPLVLYVAEVSLGKQGTLDLLLIPTTAVYY